MRRLTISGNACAETLAVLITMAWADGRLDEAERAGVRAASSVFNLTKELRARLDTMLEKPSPLDLSRLDTLSPRDRAFAYVAAAWMSAIDDDVEKREAALLDHLGSRFGFDGGRRTELERIARDLDRGLPGARDWSSELAKLFRAIPPLLVEELSDDEYEVAFE
jgi:uncharacterized membrane protein YebE (DUF533 family)